MILGKFLGFVVSVPGEVTDSFFCPSCCMCIHMRNYGGSVLVGRTTDRSAQELIQCLINILYIRIISGRSVILLIEKDEDA